jgi:hypothetical protein
MLVYIIFPRIALFASLLSPPNLRPNSSGNIFTYKKGKGQARQRKQACYQKANNTYVSLLTRN